MARSGVFGDLTRLRRTRDLSLPDWGPYAKAHLALSHIADRKRGTLFECVIIPGVQGRRRYYPDRRDCLDFGPLDANAELSFWAMRCRMGGGTHADLRTFGDADDVRLSRLRIRETPGFEITAKGNSRWQSYPQRTIRGARNTYEILNTVHYTDEK